MTFTEAHWRCVCRLLCVECGASGSCVPELAEGREGRRVRAKWLLKYALDDCSPTMIHAVGIKERLGTNCGVFASVLY